LQFVGLPVHKRTRVALVYTTYELNHPKPEMGVRVNGPKECGTFTLT